MAHPISFTWLLVTPKAGTTQEKMQGDREARCARPQLARSRARLTAGFFDAERESVKVYGLEPEVRLLRRGSVNAARAEEICRGACGYYEKSMGRRCFGGRHQREFASFSRERKGERLHDSPIDLSKTHVTNIWNNKCCFFTSLSCNEYLAPAKER